MNNKFPELETILAEKQLTPREIELAINVAQGLSNKECGNQMFVSEVTVKTMLSVIYAKMNVKSRAQLIVWCLPHMGWADHPQVVQSTSDLATNLFDHTRDEVNAQIFKNSDELQHMELVFGGTFIMKTDNSIRVYGSDNIDMKVIFVIDKLNNAQDVHNVEILVKEKLESEGYTVMSEQEFKTNMSSKGTV